MKTKQEAINFAKSSASMAVDCWRDYDSLQHSINSHRDNVVDTTNHPGAVEFQLDALDAYDAEVTRLQPTVRPTITEDDIEDAGAQWEVQHGRPEFPRGEFPFGHA